MNQGKHAPRQNLTKATSPDAAPPAPSRVLSLAQAESSSLQDWQNGDSKMRNTLRKLHAGFGDFRDLIALSLAGNPISDLAPLKDLTALQSLDCAATQVSDLAPLKDLTALQSLDRSNTQVSDLVPLLGLPSLTILHAQRCRLEDFPHQLLFGGSLQELLLTETIPPCANVT